MCFRMPTDAVLKVSYSFLRVQNNCGSLKLYVQKLYLSDSKLFRVLFFVEMLNGGVKIQF